jgi:hypothetical protein
MGPRLARMRLRLARKRLKEIEYGLKWLYRTRIFLDFQVQWQNDELDGAYCTLGQLIAQLEREGQLATTSSLAAWCAGRACDGRVSSS